MPTFHSFLHRFTTLLAIAGMTTMLYACGGSDGSDDDFEARAYTGAGSKWDVSLDADDNTFVVTLRASASDPVVLTVEGTYESFASGFLRLTVGSASGTDAPSPGDQAWALEIEGYAFILKPIDPSSDQIIPMINAGDCPTSDIAANWVMVKSNNDATSATTDFYGEFNYAVATDTPSLPAKYSLTHATVTGGGIPGTGTCEDGLMLVSDAEMFLTASSGAIVHTDITNPTNSQIIFAFEQKAISDIANTDGDYAGLLFDGSETGGDRVQAVSVDCTSGACTGTIVTDLVNNTLSTDTVTINLSGTVDSPLDGFVTGTIDDGGMTPGNLSCMFDIDVLGSGKKIVSCVGQSPGGNTDMFNVLLVSK